MIVSKVKLVLAVSIVVIASPALAKKQHVHPGYEARAEAPAFDAADGMSASRANALRECNAEANKLVQKDWGVMQGTRERACMTMHGETE